VSDSVYNGLDTNLKPEQNIVASTSNQTDTSSQVFMAVLKSGIDSMNATINDTTIFIVTKGQLFLYWNNPHTVLIPDGRSAYIPPEQIMRVDSPYFKFNFSKWDFVKQKDYKLYKVAKGEGIDLNSLIKRIQNKDDDALLQFYNLQTIVDGASAEEFPYDFWALINLWTDKELSTFITTLKTDEKKGFCSLLIESSFTNPYEYYKLYYPLTWKQIEAAK